MGDCEKQYDSLQWIAGGTAAICSLSLTMPNPNPPPIGRTAYRRPLLRILAFDVCLAGHATVKAEAIGVVAPTFDGLMSGIFVPLLILFGLTVFMLMRERRILPLIGGLCGGVLWTAVSFGLSVKSWNTAWERVAVGAFSASIWVTVGFVLYGLYRAEDESLGIFKNSGRRSVRSERDGPRGRCPTCHAIIALNALECRRCQASFGPGSPVKIERIRK